MFGGVAHRLEQDAHNVLVGGSIPPTPTILNLLQKLPSTLRNVSLGNFNINAKLSVFGLLIKQMDNLKKIGYTSMTTNSRRLTVKNSISKDTIKQFNHWTVLFREDQITPGSLIIVLNDLSKRSLGDVPSAAWAEFGEVCSFIEVTVKNVFPAEKFNYLALMMGDKEVHFHVIPRYSKPIHINGNEYTDPDWPLATKLQTLDMDKKTTEHIHQLLIRSASE